MIIVHCQTTSWEWTGWVFRVNFLCPHGLRLTLALPLSFHQSGLYRFCLISYLIPFPFPATRAKAELSCARLKPSHSEPSLMYLVLPDTPSGHGQNSRCLLSEAECMWKTYRGLEPWDSDLWLFDLPKWMCWKEPLRFMQHGAGEKL